MDNLLIAISNLEKVEIDFGEKEFLNLSDEFVISYVEVVKQGIFINSGDFYNFDSIMNFYVKFLNLIYDQAAGLRNAPSIFISYSGKDDECDTPVPRLFYQQVKSLLPSEFSYCVFFDKDFESMKSGDVGLRVLLEAVSFCKVGVVFLNDNFLSKWPLTELFLFLARKTRPHCLSVKLDEIHLLPLCTDSFGQDSSLECNSAWIKRFSEGLPPWKSFSNSVNIANCFNVSILEKMALEVTRMSGKTVLGSLYENLFIYIRAKDTKSILSLMRILHNNKYWSAKDDHTFLEYFLKGSPINPNADPVLFIGKNGSLKKKKKYSLDLEVLKVFVEFYNSNLNMKESLLNSRINVLSKAARCNNAHELLSYALRSPLSEVFIIIELGGVFSGKSFFKHLVENLKVGLLEVSEISSLFEQCVNDRIIKTFLKTNELNLLLVESFFMDSMPLVKFYKCLSKRCKELTSREVRLESIRVMNNLLFFSSGIFEIHILRTPIKEITDSGIAYLILNHIRNLKRKLERLSSSGAVCDSSDWSWIPQYLDDLSHPVKAFDFFESYARASETEEINRRLICDFLSAIK